METTLEYLYNWGTVLLDHFRERLSELQFSDGIFDKEHFRHAGEFIGGQVLVLLAAFAALPAFDLKHKLNVWTKWLLVSATACLIASEFAYETEICKSVGALAEVDAMFLSVSAFCLVFVVRRLPNGPEPEPTIPGPRLELGPTVDDDKLIRDQKTSFANKLSSGKLIGRQWALDEIARWRNYGKEKCLAIVGDTGMGKSAIAAELVRQATERSPTHYLDRRPRLIAYYLCDRADQKTLAPRLFIDTLAAMLKREFPAYARWAEEHPNPEAGFRDRILAPLERILAPTEQVQDDGQTLYNRYYILVDGLDEASVYTDPDGGPTITGLLYDQLANFPKALGLVVTTRPDPNAAHFNIREIELRSDSPQNIEDVGKFLKERLPKPLTPEQTRLLVVRSAGNMLYLEKVTEAMAGGRYANLRDLPIGLENFFEDDFLDRFGAGKSEAYQAKARLLAVVIAARVPLTSTQLQRVERLKSSADLNEILERLTSYLTMIGDQTYKLCHDSVREWLVREWMKSGRRNDFWIDVQAGHAALARMANEVLGLLREAPYTTFSRIHDSFCDYVLHHGMYHLLAAGQPAQAVDLVALFQEKKMAWEGVVGQGALDGHIKQLFQGIRAHLEETASSPDRDQKVMLEKATQAIQPARLVELVKDYYEIDPLGGPLEVLVRYRDPEQWAGLLDELLGAQNFVVRYALADAMAEACEGPHEVVTAAELGALLINGKDVNHREVGAYALRHIYARKPKRIVPAYLDELARSETYPGRSALGDLLLNLSIQKRPCNHLVTERRFWEPVWDMHKLDIWDLKANDYRSKDKAPADNEEAGVVAAYWKLHTIYGWRRTAKDKYKKQNIGRVRRLLKNYSSLGRDDDILAAHQDLIALSDADLKQVMGLLFAHPLWAVGEAAATQMSSIVEEAKDPDDRKHRLDIIKELLEVEYCLLGAIEAAFAVRHLDRHIFLGAVTKFYQHASPRVRGLCAENLVSMVLHSNESADADLLEEFKEQIQRWLRDDDCWVLDHMYRLMRGLENREEGLPRWELSVAESPLLGDTPNWFHLDREHFLLHIEEKKRRLVA